MQKQAPSVGRILTMVVFALTCFGLLLFLWLAFGGATPLKPQGYRFHITFPESGQLAEQADVRISGVSVGKVTKLDPATNGTTDATLQLETPYAPLPADARAILRQKTLLGETYVELSPGVRGTPTIPENGRLAVGHVAPTVELDEILSAFNPKTRAAFQTWIQTTAVATAGRGLDLSNALGNLPPFVDNTDELLTLLNSQEGAVQQLVRNTGTVFNALSTRQGQLSGLIRNANTVFATTAQRNEALQQTFIALPTFERESTLTLNRLDEFAHNTNPLVTQLQPVAEQATPTLQALAKFAPVLKSVFVNITPVLTAGTKGLPAVRGFLNDIEPLLGAFDQPLRQITPILYGLSFYKPELTAFLANSAAATNAESGPGGQDAGVNLKYLRTSNPLNPENLANFPNRIASNRASPYTYPGAFNALNTGLSSYNTLSCGNVMPILGGGGESPDHVANPTLHDLVLETAYEGDPTGANVLRPPCKQQSKFPNADGSLTTYPQITAATTPVARR
jgi:phospholipid/cholesterol/gamma-HCH transport system substrate-binding protein